MPKSKSKDVAANFDPEFTANKTQFTKIDKRYIAQIDQSVRVTNTTCFSKGAACMGKCLTCSPFFFLQRSLTALTMLPAKNRAPAVHAPTSFESSLVRLALNVHTEL